MKKVCFVLFSLLMLSCNGQKTESSKVSVAEFTELMTSQDVQLVDVRTPMEFSQGYIAGAQNIDWFAEDFNQKVAKLDKSKPVLVYCKVGGRSAEAASRLEELGFERIYDLEGGYLKWQAIKEPATEWSGMTVADFEKLKTSKPELLVNFYAEWCGPCKKMAPYMNRLIEQGEGNAVRIDVDKNKSLFHALKLEELPVIIIYRNGKETFTHIGFLSEADLKKHWP